MIRSYLGMACLLLAVTYSGVCLGADQPKLHPGSARIIPPEPGYGQNLVPNASFECGTDGWGSAELDRLLDWYGPLNGLFGHLDASTATDGHNSLKIELTPKNQPVEYDDYLHTQSRRIRAPLAANVGWIAVKPGQSYTFSVAMKAAEAETPARLVVRQFRAAPIEKFVRLSTGWQRYTLTFCPKTEACYVLAGPDLRATKECPHPPKQATVWLDAVQLAPGTEERAFAPRQPIEMGIVTDKPGNIFAWDEPLKFHVTLASGDAREVRNAVVEVRLTDFFDHEVWRDDLSVSVGRKATLTRDVAVPASPQRRGFLRLHATLKSGSTVQQRKLRLASIPVYDQKDSCFGLNHAFGWPDMLDLCRQAGLVWARDWSLKWQDVEPAKGHFTFAETDAEINHILRQGIKVMSVPGFPSNMWSTTAPASVKQHDPWYETSSKAPDPETQRDDVLAEVGWPFKRMAYPPRDMAEFKNYVAQIVGHYKGRIRDWEVFNESLYTSYSLPNAAGFKMADYLRYQAAFIEAARNANPECRILGGCCYVSERMDNPGEFIKLGGLKNIDVFTLHYYPGQTPPEQFEPWYQRLSRMMDQYGVRRPIWITETAYSADDEPWITPPNVYAPSPAYLPNERMQAEYEVRYNTILLANGVEKIFYHAGTGSGINHSNLWTMFLRYGSEPYKSYASQAVQAKLLTPSCKFVKRLLPGTSLWAYLFHDGKRAVGVVWAPAGTKPKEVQLTDAKLQLWDMMGRPQAARTFTPGESPMYVIGEGVSAAEFEKAVGLVSAR
jgi:hypothetical protein